MASAVNFAYDPAFVRAEPTRVRRTLVSDPPRLLLTVGKGRTVDEVALFDAEVPE
jgi:hypothetical protein